MDGSETPDNNATDWERVGSAVTGIIGIVGVIFTWPAGAQGRKHAEHMVARAHAAENQEACRRERREAYFCALRAQTGLPPAVRTLWARWVGPAARTVGR